MPEPNPPLPATPTHEERKAAIVGSKVLLRDEARRFREYCDELAAKLTASEAALESERAVCRLATATKENYRKLREAAEKRAQTAEGQLFDARERIEEWKRLVEQRDEAIACADKPRADAEQEAELLKRALEYPPDNSTQYRCSQLEGLLREERGVSEHYRQEAARLRAVRIPCDCCCGEWCGGCTVQVGSPKRGRSMTIAEFVESKGSR